MAFTGKAETITDEQLGAFTGYIRRPKPNSFGMTAQIYGEDGDDADTILALSLTKFQEALVYVNVYLVKDPNGQIMKEGNSYPLIASFSGFVRRSLPTKGGMIAQIYGPNGEDADEISKLSKSLYQDALVFVDIRGNLAKDKDKNKIINIEEENAKEIDIHCLDKYTKVEKKNAIAQEKKFKKMNELIHVKEFSYRVEVALALGRGEEFRDWLIQHKGCCHMQDGNCMNDSGVIEIPFLFKPFNYLPVCEEHKAALNDDNHVMPAKFYYEMKHRFLLKEWVWSILKERFSFNGNSEPDPEKIISWAASKGLSKFLPANYTAVL